MIQDAIRHLIDGQHLSAQEAYDTLAEVMRGEATEAQIGALLVALRLRGEEPAEVAGFARAMRDHALAVPTRHACLVDTCGTGGDSSGTFNISTTAAFVVAGAGVPVAKHGNRAASSLCGSADVLRELGVCVELSPHAAGRCLDEIGIGFLFALGLHPAMAHAAGPRRELGLRTVFNLLGPLSNPAGARRQLLGVFSPAAARLMAAALHDLGAEHALVVHGEDGLDEITTTGPTLVVEVRAAEITEWTLTPEELGLARARPEDLKGGDPACNAEMLTAVLSGAPGPARDITLLNAAAGIYVGGAAPDLARGLRLAAGSVDSGAAAEKLQALRALSQALKGLAAEPTPAFALASEALAQADPP